MAVRFIPHDLPQRESSESEHSHNSELAEVIDLRSRLAQTVSEAHPTVAADERTSDQVSAEDTREVAVRLLARRALSSGELRRDLMRAGHAEFDVEEVVESFIESLYLDDAGLAQALTEKLRERKQASRSQIRMKLRERLLPDAVIELSLGALDDEEEDALLTAAAQDRAKRMVGLERQVAERRLLGYLARRGWSGESARRACREALDEAGSAQRSGVRFT